MLICEVPLLKVRLVVCPVFQAVPPDNVTVLLPRVMVLVPVPVDESNSAVTAKFAVLKVPCVIVNVLEAMFNASPSVTVMPEPLTVTPLNVLPAVVSVAVAVNVIVPVWV